MAAKPLGNVGAWSAVDDALHDFYRLYRYVSEADALADTNGEVAAETTRLEVRDEAALTAGENYSYRVASIDSYGNESVKSAVQTVMARLVSDADLDIPDTLALISTDIGAAVAAEAAARAAEIAAEADARGALAIAAFQELRRQSDLAAQTGSDLIETAMIAAEATQSLRREVVTQANSDRASFTEQINVATAANSALASRTTTLEAETAALTASVEEIELAYVAGDEALAQTIASLAVGTNTQFDPVKIWYFDASTEGWGGNGTPVAEDGYLTPAAEASDPYVTSPAGLAVAGDSYRQMRARARKTGAPIWEGWLWWKGESDADWDGARRVAITEPAWDGSGFGEITVNAGWSGTIAQIRLDLTAASDASNLVALDWVSVGRPSPGASSAALTAEQTARISADAAQAAQITSLSGRMTSAESGITGNASGLSALTGRVTTAEGAITAQADRIDGVEASLDDKADVAVVDALSAEVTAFGGADGVASIGQATRAIRNEIDLAASEAIEAAAADFLAQQGLREAAATATQGLNTRIDVTDTSLSVLNEAVTSLQTDVGGKASASSVATLGNRVTVTESGITALNEAVTSLQTDVGGKASASSVATLSNRVAVTEDGIAVLNSAVTALDSEVDGKASASSVDALVNRVEVTEDGVTALNSAVTALNTSVAGKASASSVTALGNRVTETEDGIESLATATTSLFAGDDAGNISSARMRMSAVSGPSGWARFAIQVRAQSNDSWSTAGFFLDVKNDGSDSRIVQIADRFVYRDGEGVTSSPMRVQGGVLYLNEVNISDAIIGSLQVERANIQDGAVNAAKISVTNLAAISATLGNVDISNADIGTLTVERANIANLAVNGSKIDADAISTGKIVDGAITAKDSITDISFNGKQDMTPAPRSITIDNSTQAPVFIWIDLSVSLQAFAGASDSAPNKTISVTITVVKNPASTNYEIWRQYLAVTDSSGDTAQSSLTYNPQILVADMNPTASATYQVKAVFTSSTGGIGTSSETALVEGLVRFGYAKK